MSTRTTIVLISAFILGLICLYGINSYHNSNDVHTCDSTCVDSVGAVCNVDSLNDNTQDTTDVVAP